MIQLMSCKNSKAKNAYSFLAPLEMDKLDLFGIGEQEKQMEQFLLHSKLLIQRLLFNSLSESQLLRVFLCFYSIHTLDITSWVFLSKTGRFSVPLNSVLTIYRFSCNFLLPSSF